MRTTVRLDDKLHAETKTLAAETGRTLGAVVEDALRLAPARPAPNFSRVGLAARSRLG